MSDRPSSLTDDGAGPAAAPVLVADRPHLDVERSQQTTDGVVRCVRLDVFGADGRPTRHAAQGESVQIACQFQIDGTIDVPLAWFEVRDASGRLIHGKSSLQHQALAPTDIEPGGQIVYRFEVRLDVAPGEYAVCVGLSSVDRASYEAYETGQRRFAHWPSGVVRDRLQKSPITEEQFRGRVRHHCRLTTPAVLCVGFSADGTLAHDGLVNLPGRCRVEVPDPPSRRTHSGDVPAPGLEHPTVVHVTHWKAGSQWIAQILNDCSPDRIVPSRSDASQVLRRPLEAGLIYPAVYATLDEITTLTLPENTRTFVVVRDLRDTLVSGYFSVLAVHDANVPDLPIQRRIIDGMSPDDALVYLMDDWLPASARIQLSCIELGQPVLRYEDLVADDLVLLKQLVLHDLRLPIAEERLHQIILANRFERYTAGRRRGAEDRTHHYRKGVAGDWLNHFSERVKDAFKMRYGGLLVRMGYEQDLNW